SRSRPSNSSTRASPSIRRPPSRRRRRPRVMRERVESPLRASAAAADAVTPDSGARLRLRPLSGWEEEYVERHQEEPNTARLCNEVLARCLVEPGQDPGEALDVVRNLLVAERDRELVELRRLSLGSEIA